MAQLTFDNLAKEASKLFSFLPKQKKKKAKSTVDNISKRISKFFLSHSMQNYLQLSSDIFIGRRGQICQVKSI